MTATLHDLLKSYREGGVFPSYDQLAAIAGQDQSGAAVRGEAVAECREDGRCQYAIDHGAEGMGHCPAGKCCMPDSKPAECRACNGSGWAVRDPDIGTDQECFSCGGTGEDDEAVEEVVSASAADAPSDLPTEILAKVMTRDDFNCSTELGYAQFLAWAIWLKSYRAVSPDFNIMGNLKGVLSQIDNMVCGLSRAADALDSQPGTDEPTEREALIACLGDDAVTLLRVNPDDEMAQTMREAAAMLENDGKALDSQPTEPDGLPPLPEPIEVGGEGWDFDDFKSEKTFSCEHMWAYARAAIASSQPTDGGVRNG